MTYFEIGKIVKVKRVINAERQAGWGTEKPPFYLKGRIGVITRQLINTDGYWIEFFSVELDGKVIKKFKAVLLGEELAETTLQEEERFQEISDIWEASELARKI
jgi:hypothetical protein